MLPVNVDGVSLKQLHQCTMTCRGMPMPRVWCEMTPPLLLLFFFFVVDVFSFVSVIPKHPHIILLG